MKTLAKILIAFLAVVVAAGVVIMVLEFTKDRGFEMKLEKDGVTSGQFEFSTVGLAPGRDYAKGYNVDLVAKSAGDYWITLSFDGEEGLLSDILDVEVAYDGGKIINNLSDLLNGKTVSFSCNVSKSAQISITYVMPEDAGNELQNTVADFTVTISAERQ